MSEFARNYFSLEKSVVTSFWDSVRQIKKEFDDPIDWGAFVPVGNFQSSKIKSNLDNEIVTSFAYGIAADMDSIYAVYVSNKYNGKDQPVLAKVNLSNKNKFIDLKEFEIPSDLMNTSQVAVNNESVEIVATGLDKKNISIYSLKKSSSYVTRICAKSFNEEVFVIQAFSNSKQLVVLMESSTNSILLRINKETCISTEFLSAHKFSILPLKSRFFIIDNEINNLVLIRSYDKFRDDIPTNFNGRLSRINTDINCRQKSLSDFQLIDLTNKPNLRFNFFASFFSLPIINSQSATPKYINLIEDMPCRISHSALFSLELNALVNSSRDELESYFKTYDGYHKIRKGQFSKFTKINEKYSLPLALQETPDGRLIILGSPASGPSGANLIADNLEFVGRGWELLSDAGVFLTSEKDMQIASMIGCAPKETVATNNLFAMSCNVYNSPHLSQKIKFSKLIR
jgi:hypothetical protein